MIACWHRMQKGKQWKRRIWSFNKHSIYRDFRRTSYSINKNKKGRPKSWMKLVWLRGTPQPTQTSLVTQTLRPSQEKQQKVPIAPKLLPKEVPWAQEFRVLIQVLYKALQPITLYKAKEVESSPLKAVNKLWCRHIKIQFWNRSMQRQVKSTTQRYRSL